MPHEQRRLCARTTRRSVVVSAGGAAGHAGWVALDRLCRSPATAAVRRATAPHPVVAIPVERT
jgi:hypothetical protein